MAKGHEPDYTLGHMSTFALHRYTDSGFHASLFSSIIVVPAACSSSSPYLVILVLDTVFATPAPLISRYRLIITHSLFHMKCDFKLTLIEDISPDIKQFWRQFPCTIQLCRFRCRLKQAALIK